MRLNAHGFSDDVGLSLNLLTVELTEPSRKKFARKKDLLPLTQVKFFRDTKELSDENKTAC